MPLSDTGIEAKNQNTVGKTPPHGLKKRQTKEPTSDRSRRRACLPGHRSLSMSIIHIHTWMNALYEKNPMVSRLNFERLIYRSYRSINSIITNRTAVKLIAGKQKRGRITLITKIMMIISYIS
ncbi:hypothetical protein DUA46_25150 [Salmonella enterica subsp. enterica]|nr:hypothetical protein [Salmonella enterica subsp. enterica serovar Muenchen]